MPALDLAGGESETQVQSGGSFIMPAPDLDQVSVTSDLELQI